MPGTNSSGPDPGKKPPFKHGPKTTGTLQKGVKPPKADKAASSGPSGSSAKASSSTTSSKRSSDSSRERRRLDKGKTWVGNTYLKDPKPFGEWKGAKWSLKALEVSPQIPLSSNSLIQGLEKEEIPKSGNKSPEQKCTGRQGPGLQASSSRSPCIYCNFSSVTSQETSVSSPLSGESSHARPTEKEDNTPPSKKVEEVPEPTRHAPVLDLDEVRRVEALFGVRSIWI